MKVLGVVNQKGGVGKTTTAVNLGAYLAAGGKRVLLLDMDPQANATSGLGQRGATQGLYEALGEPARAAEYTVETVQANLFLLPATPDLAGAGVELAEDPDALTRLLASISGYDVVLIDAPPSLGPLTVNVLAAADALLIPLQAEYYALEGLAGLMETVERVQGGLNPRLKVLGVVLTMFDGRTNLSQDVESMVRQHFGELVFWSVVPRNVRLSEAPSFAKPINAFAPLSAGAAAYKRLSEEVMQRVEKSSLGRGLDALLGKPAESAPGAQVQSLKVEKIVQAAYQPRQVFTPESLAELAQSIRDKGVLQPLLVRPRDDHFEIVAGERRWRASQLAGLTELPVIIRDLGDREALEIAIVENLQREDLGALEEARAYQALMEQGLNQEGVAQAVGKSRSAVSNALRLLTLPAPALRALDDGQISAGHARAILAQPDTDRAWALEQITARSLSVREAEALKREKREPTPIKVNPPRAFRQVELDLSRRTGTRVRITGEDKGRVELNYASREELDRILEILGYAAEE